MAMEGYGAVGVMVALVVSKVAEMMNAFSKGKMLYVLALGDGRGEFRALVTVE
jgi:hypothetical protein